MHGRKEFIPDKTSEFNEIKNHCKKIRNRIKRVITKSLNKSLYKSVSTYWDWDWTGSSHGKEPVKYLNELAAKNNTVAELTKQTTATVVITLIFLPHLYYLFILPLSAPAFVEIIVVSSILLIRNGQINYWKQKTEIPEKLKGCNNKKKKQVV